ncbi:WD40 repeat-like protein [Sporormia fimetaria CBS 119925]|uniref:WD40 repeat-like protein n=1 Tax=Sporormia fimetaria CBS 119925 TaxID=1340428 RepID=A0A6A6V0N4_9PLEO|nr:WD40 repeat-like protein [Sporormia fimetaria CBS 119925]
MAGARRVHGPAAEKASKKRNVAPTQSKPVKATRRTEREESISGSESSDDERDNIVEDVEEDESSADEDETAAERRLRLAERYLENIREEVEDNVGFDAAEIDRDLIAERLKEDVAETKGKVYRRIADTLDFEGASHVFGKWKWQHSVTGCALRLPYAWTIGKDLVLEKWELADPSTWRSPDADRPSNITPRKTPRRLLWRRGDRSKKTDRNYLGHTAPIVSIAVSDSGKYLATGDEDARLIIWDAESLTPLKLFTQHRAAVTSLSFRRGTEQLFSASADRTIKIWSASEMAYIETLFGHQDIVIDIAGGLDETQETCVSVGARDRTARLWKVVEESQLVFRGGGTARQKGMDKLRKGRFGANVDGEEKHTNHVNGVGEDADDDTDPPEAYAEGSIDCVALLDSQLFVTGSDNGALCLWSVNRKKPLFTIPLAHGRDPPIPPEEMSSDGNVKAPRLARYITALATVPFADLILTASWDGWIRAWRLGPEKRSIESMGKVGRMSQAAGVITGLSVVERGDRGKQGVCVVAAVGSEPRLGRWMTKKVRSALAVFEVPRKMLSNGAEESADEEDDDA